MEVVNPFILKNKERMIVFLDQLSSITDPTPPPGCMNDSNSSDQLYSDSGKIFLLLFFEQILFVVVLGRELATLHHICVSHLTDLQALAKTNLSIKKLVTVTDMLTKHKIKYREMIS